MCEACFDGEDFQLRRSAHPGGVVKVQEDLTARCEEAGEYCGGHRKPGGILGKCCEHRLLSVTTLTSGLLAAMLLFCLDATRFSFSRRKR